MRCTGLRAAAALINLHHLADSLKAFYFHPYFLPISSKDVFTQALKHTTCQSLTSVIIVTPPPH